MKQKTIEEVRQYLQEKNADFSEVTEGTLPNIVDVEVVWGDWKHSHIYLDHIMSEIGYNLVCKETTEEDGSDTYSAVHTFMFATKEEIEGFRKLFA